MADGDRDPFNRNIQKGGSLTQETMTNVDNIHNETEVVSLDNKDFDYNQLDRDTAEQLKNLEEQLHSATQDFYTQVGEILYNAQQLLADRSNGTFIKWFKSLGLSKNKVYRLINRYKVIKDTKSLKEQKLIKHLPLTLSYALSRENVPEEIKQKILDQEITSSSEFYDEMKKYKDDGDSSNQEYYRFSEKQLQKKEKQISNIISNVLPEPDKTTIDTVVKQIIQTIKE